MWPARPKELEEAQHALARMRPAPWRPPARTLAVAACAVRFPRGDDARGARGDPAWSAAVVLRGRAVLARAVAGGTAGAPYAPGLLALREGPLLEHAVLALEHAPDVLLLDATGRDHPRRAGLATHLGAVLDVPTVGVTHRPLIARGGEPGPERGAISPLLLDGEPVAAWLRTRAGARPVAVHPGWRTDLDVAIAVVLAATRGHRTPEPIRAARRAAREARAGAVAR